MNEARAIEKLCRRQSHENIVVVLKHGFLENSQYYYIDMELCDITLNSYIYDKNPDYMEPLYYKVQEGQAPVVKARALWEIIWDIVSGLKFVHDHKEVHRDLKPQNGKNILIQAWGLLF